MFVVDTTDVDVAAPALPGAVHRPALTRPRAGTERVMRKLCGPAVVMVLVLLFVPGVAQSTQAIAHKVSSGLHSAGNDIHQFLAALS